MSPLTRLLPLCPVQCATQLCSATFLLILILLCLILRRNSLVSCRLLSESVVKDWRSRVDTLVNLGSLLPSVPSYPMKPVPTQLALTSLALTLARHFLSLQGVLGLYSLLLLGLLV